MSKRIVCFGEIMMRLNPEGYLRFVQAEKFECSYGGGEANVAVSLANYGMDASYVTKLPDNPLGASARNEVRRFGISVCAVMPGDTRTGFTDARQKSAAGDEVYGGAVSRSVSRMEKDERGGVSPDKVADKVLRLARRKRVGPLHAVGFVYGLCVLLMRVLPSGLANRILGMLYAN